MKDIIIVCAGGFGLEVLDVIKKINHRKISEGKEAKYNILGFLDDNPHALDSTDIKIPILGGISDWEPMENEVYAIGVAFGELKQKISTTLKSKGCCFETLVAPWSIVADDCKIGEGCFISAYSISAGVELGNFVNINGSMICPGAFIDDYSTTTGLTVVENAIIGKRVFVGSHAVISSGVSVGNDAQVSVGSIVTENVPSGATVFGVPAKRMD